ncbi:17173_t:CDS:2 [Acaulospora morrowiae]|uniref:17173_t:CDS:1 n=1 Tax=Acaulospora morrowiae TaxID=94023 RepID=A0A9N9G8L6_9GLOM|nr:17173_t:CDS:2 [Acaulospora morrowiae]
MESQDHLDVLCSQNSNAVPKCSPRHNSKLRNNRKSRVWNYFTIFDNSSSSKIHKARCILPGCGKEIFYRGSLSALRYHLRHFHNIIIGTNISQLYNQDQQRSLSQCHPKKLSSKKGHFTTRENFLQFIKYANPYCIPSENVKSRMTNSYSNLFSKLKSMLQQANSVALAIVCWELDGQDSYMEITCHWISDDFQLHKILLDFVPVPKFFDDNDIHKSIKRVLSAWELDGKVNSITGRNIWDRVHLAVRKFNNITQVECMSFVKNFSTYILEPDLDLHIPTFEEMHQFLSIKDEKNIRELSGKISTGIKNSQQLIKYLINYENDFLKETLEDSENNGVEDLKRCINEPIFMLEYLVVLEEPIRKLIMTLSDNLETASKGMWMNNLLPDATIIKFFDDLSSHLKQLKDAVKKLGETHYSFYDLLVEYFNLEGQLEIHNEKIGENMDDGQLFLNEILIKFFISDIFEEFNCRSDYFTYYKIASLNPRFKDIFNDNYVMVEDTYDLIESEYLELCEGETTQSQLVNSELATSSSHLGNNEFERYEILSQHNQSTYDDPVDWWRQHRKELPFMAKIAQKYLAIPVICYSLDRTYSEHCQNLKVLLNDLKDFDVIQKWEYL